MNVPFSHTYMYATDENQLRRNPRDLCYVLNRKGQDYVYVKREHRGTWQKWNVIWGVQLRQKQQGINMSRDVDIYASMHSKTEA